jgi:hypothetical protein
MKPPQFGGQAASFKAAITAFSDKSNRFQLPPLAVITAVQTQTDRYCQAVIGQLQTLSPNDCHPKSGRWLRMLGRLLRTRNDAYRIYRDLL